MDFKKGQQVVHCRDGLAVIVDETMIGDNSYFVVKTIRGAGENIYVPLTRAESIIRPIMSVEEADKLIEKAKHIELEFNANTKQRRDSLKRRLMSGDVNDSIHLFKQLYFYKETKDPNVKFGPVDLDMLQFASDNLLDELSLTYNKPRDEIEAFVYAKLR